MKAKADMTNADCIFCIDRLGDSIDCTCKSVCEDPKCPLRKPLIGGKK